MTSWFRRAVIVLAGSAASVGLVGLVALAQETRPTSRATTTTSSPAATTTAVAAATVPAGPSPEVRGRIEATIKDLSAETWKDRQAAQEKLVTFGQDATEILRRLVAKSTDEEVRTRAGAALRQIEENAQTGASLVTMKFNSAKPQDVFAELARQARCEFTTQPKNMWTMRNYPAVTMDLERVNFWTAFKDACTKSGVSPVLWGNQQRGIQLSPHGGNVQWNGPTVFSGPFMIVAQRIYKNSSIDLANQGNVQREFSIQMMAFVEPKIRVLQSSFNVKVDEAVDDKGNSLVSTDRMYDGYSGGNQWAWNMTARLAWPENPGTRLTRFKGSMRFLVQTKSETLDVPEITKAKNLTKTIAGRRILIKELKTTGAGYELSVTMYRDGLGQNEWNTMDYPYYSMRLTDKEGRQLNANSSSSGMGPMERTYQWTFSRDSWGPDNEKAGEPYRLTWELPLETRETRAAFEFKDMPLPN
jgi:hypothetical protein